MERESPYYYDTDDGPQPLGRSGTRVSADAGKSSVLSRVFTGLSLSRRASETAEELKGPFGLNLLSDPAEPIVDFIFVHGLGGGSRKTWSKGPDPTLFWPKEWLSREADFKNVRIHSFGYDSDWVERRESVLDIQDFANTLLAALQGSSSVRRSPNLPIVLIAHSMGGLVIKKAYLLAQHEPFQDLGKRFHSMYFLATPHHGASSAQLLSIILRASHSGNRPFVGDLHHESPAIQAINDEFRHYESKLQLYSFFETRATRFGGIKDKIIVKKSSAIIGYPKERTAHLDADHRGVCKFDSPSDPNFITVKNALVETLDKIKEKWDSSNREQLRNQRRRLKSFLGITDQLEDNSVNFDEPRTEGSCEWLTQKSNFRRWRDSTNTKVFCLTGNPATGKSFLAQYVVEHLTGLSYDCSYHFFKEGDKLKSALSKSLLSLAYQMSSSNVAIREAILEMQDDDVQIDTENHQSIWKKIFVGNILQLSASKTHYWVLDALDECKNFIDLLPLIFRTKSTFPLRIFVTSRPSLELQSSLQPMDPPAEVQHIFPKYTLADIRSYVESHTDFPSMQEHKTRQQLVATILDKSEGSFLWVRLVLKELRKLHSATATRRILEDVPQGMDKLYNRILETMSTSMASYGKPLAKAVLMWAVCSVRSLTTYELQHALQLDINDTVPNLESQIASLCGHLVYVDSEMRIKMIHQTARKFLLSTDTESEFAFQEKYGHRQLAMACLRCLLADEMKAPRSRRPSAAHQDLQRSPLLEYAATSFYEHVDRTSSEDQELLNMLYTFLGSPSGNVQSWIEHIARSGELNHLIQTGMVLKTYAKRRAKHIPALGKEIKMVESWSTDLTRIVAKFGRNLLRFPQSVYHIIPPFCPREAAPYKQFGKSARGIQVVGLSSTTWDDCLACIIYRNSTTTSVACTGSHFAIGSSNKLVRLYRTATCQEFGKLEHGEFVKYLEFNISGQLLASAGRRCVRVWDVADQELLWLYQSRSPCIAMSFTADNKMLLLACQDNHIYSFDLLQGICSQSQPWYMDVDNSTPIHKPPDTAAFSLEHDLLAFVYRGGHINLWNWKDGYFVGTCEKPSAREERLPFHASSLVFNPGTNTDSLAAAYEAGQLIVFDPLEGDIKATYKADADSQTLASSPDGRTLISGDSSGTIRIFDFETFISEKLKLLHIIYGRGDNIRSMAFCGDSLRFVDIRGHQNNVWEPAVLVRPDVGDALTDTLSIDLQETELPEARHINKITEIATESKGEYIFCGTEDGMVTVFQTRTGEQSQILYKHSSGISVTRLVFEGTKSVIASADSSSRVLVRQVTLTSGKWNINSNLLEHRMMEPVEQLLYSPDGTKLLIVTTAEDTLYALSGEVIASVVWATRNRGIWATHPQRPTQLLLVVGRRVRIYEWDTLKELSGHSGIELDFDLPSELEIRGVYAGWSSHILATEYSTPSRSRSPIRLLLWETSRLAMSESSITPHRSLELFGNRLAQLIGTFGMIIGMMRESILFLDHDGWICSVEMEDSVPQYYKRHFFLPYDWLSTSAHLLIAVTAKHEVVFGKEDELAIIKKGFECIEQMPFEPDLQ